jgi:hypothetical protein
MKIHLYLLALATILASQVEAQVIRGPGADVTGTEILRCEFKDGVSQPIEKTLEKKIDRVSKKMKVMPVTIPGRYGESYQIKPDSTNAEGNLEMTIVSKTGETLGSTIIKNGDSLQIDESYGSNLRSCSLTTMKDGIQKATSTLNQVNSKPNLTLPLSRTKNASRIFDDTDPASALNKGRSARRDDFESAVPTPSHPSPKYYEHDNLLPGNGRTPPTSPATSQSPRNAK